MCENTCFKLLKFVLLMQLAIGTYKCVCVYMCVCYVAWGGGCACVCVCVCVRERDKRERGVLCFKNEQ